jgi:hypothetical protein
MEVFIAESEHWCGKCNSVIKIGERYVFFWQEVDAIQGQPKIKRFPVHERCVDGDSNADNR